MEKTMPLKAGTNIAQLSIAQATTEYTIAFRTCPDDTMRRFVPGIGFTDFFYTHHGTVTDINEHLAAIQF